MLSRFLSYICEKYFAGEKDQIKEYNVAVEALGRPPDFDHSQDSIVRVEAHRLRKRLKKYYEENGKGHELQIVIPPGRYVPEFTTRRPAVASESSKPPPGTRRILVAAAAVILLVVLAIFTFRMVESSVFSPSPPSRASASSMELEPGPRAALRISAGAPNGQYVDDFGGVWERDQYYVGGQAIEAEPPEQLMGLPDWPFRWYRQGRFSYEIPLDPGVYQLQLYFAAVDQAGGVFKIKFNGRTLVNSRDLKRDVGAGMVDVQVFTDVSPADDGVLHLGFAGRATLHGMEILPGVPGKLRPIRILAGRATGHHDAQGRYWQGDRYVQGGRTAKRNQRVTGVTDHNLFKGERYGNFVYALPVVPGTYTLKLMFAETWFGSRNAGGGGIRSRIFDVTCNGKILLERFDILRESGGENRGLAKTFTGIQADGRNKVVINFTSRENFAAINAIELIPE